MTNETNVHRSRRSGSVEAPLQTRANTIVKASDHGTPLELSDITIRYGGGKGGAEAVSVVEGGHRDRRTIGGLKPDSRRDAIAVLDKCGGQRDGPQGIKLFTERQVRQLVAGLGLCG